MIDRYTRPEMGRIWSLENKFEIWKEIEVLATEAQAELGIVPREDAIAVRERAAFEVERVGGASLRLALQCRCGDEVRVRMRQPNGGFIDATVDGRI